MPSTRAWRTSERTDALSACNVRQAWLGGAVIVSVDGRAIGLMENADQRPALHRGWLFGDRITTLTRNAMTTGDTEGDRVSDAADET